MKIKTEERKETCCGDYTQYQLDEWDKDDWFCADCFLKELIDSEAEYQIIPRFCDLKIKEFKRLRKELKGGNK